MPVKPRQLWLALAALATMLAAGTAEARNSFQIISAGKDAGAGGFHRFKPHAAPQSTHLPGWRQPLVSKGPMGGGTNEPYFTIELKKGR
jgi:hypothetical protein